MLEEILKSINENLLKIANALEGQKNLESVKKIDENPQNIGALPNTMPHVQTPVMQTERMPAEPVAKLQFQATTAVVPQAIPTAQANFTMDQLAVAMSNAVNAGKMNTVLEILHSFGVQALTQVNPNDYSKLATKLKENGIEV